MAIKEMLVKKAEKDLKQALDNNCCIPYTKYDGNIGRTGHAKELGLTKGRWPKKSVRIVIGLIKNTVSNGEMKKLNIDKLII